MQAMSEIVLNQLLARPGGRTLIRACQLDLTMKDLMVLQILRVYTLDPSDPNVMVSVRELAAIGAAGNLFTKSQLETSIKRLGDSGLVIREQRDKRNREISVTTLLPLAFQVLEALGDQPVGVLPPTLRGLLAGEDGRLIEAVQAAWDNSDLPDPAVASLYRGGGEGWARVEALLRSRFEAGMRQMEAAVEEQELREQRRASGIHTVQVFGGDRVEVDARLIEQEAPAGCSVEVAVEVLAIAEQTRPGTITRQNVHARLAEALYSRHVGFASGLDAARAITVIGRQMAKETWSRPYSIRQGWYTVCERAIRAGANRACPQVSENRLS